MRQRLIAITIAFFSVFTSTAAFADKGCKDIPSRCAIEVGGRCDPVTGHWAVGKNGASGTVSSHNDCISRIVVQILKRDKDKK
jgi:hypothetical protein